MLTLQSPRCPHPNCPPPWPVVQDADEVELLMMEVVTGSGERLGRKTKISALFGQSRIELAHAPEETGPGLPPGASALLGQLAA